MSNIGEIIRTMRLSRGMSQIDLAERVGLKRTAVSNWEAGIREPDLDTLEALADVFNVSLGDLVNGDRDRNKDDDDLWTLREEMRRDPNRRALMQLARNGTAQDVRQAMALIDALRATNSEFYDGDDPA